MPLAYMAVFRQASLEPRPIISEFLQEILSIDRNVLELFCVSLFSDFLAGLHKKFQVSSTNGTNVEQQI